MREMIITCVETILTRGVQENAKINEWLTQVEEEMKNTLAILMHEAFMELQAMEFSPDVYLKWIDKYPTQLVVLAAQVRPRLRNVLIHTKY